MNFADWAGIVSLLVALVILWQFRQVLLLVFMATVLAIALNSLVRWLARRFQLGRGKAIPLSLLLVLLGAVLIASIILPPFVTQFSALLPNLGKGLNQLFIDFNRFLENPPAWFPAIALDNLPDISFTELSRQLGAIGQRVFSQFFSFFSTSAAILLQLLLVVVLTAMLVANPMAYRRLVLRLLPSWYRRRADEVFSQCEVVLLAWLGGMCADSLFVGICSFTGLLFLQVNFAFAHAVLAASFNFIPNLGPFLSAIFPVSIALLDSPGKAIAVVILYVFIQNLESYWFAPMIMQKQVSLLPAATLVAQLFFATFLGPLGLVLALPLAVVTKTWIEEAWIKDVLDQRQANPLQWATPELSGGHAVHETEPAGNLESRLDTDQSVADQSLSAPIQPEPRDRKTDVTDDLH